MQIKIPYTSPVDRAQLPDIAAHITRLEARRRRIESVAKICYCAAAVLFALLFGVLLCTLLYAVEKGDPENAAVLADIEKIPVLGFLTQWSYRTILNGMQTTAVSALRLLAVLLTPGILACLAAWLIPKFGGAKEKPAAENENAPQAEEYDPDELNNRLYRLGKKIDKQGLVLVRVTSGLLVLWGYAYLIYGMLCEGRNGLSDFSGSELVGTLIGMLVCAPLLFFLLLGIQKLFLLPVRIPTRMLPSSSCRKLRGELEKLSAAIKEEAREKARKELESMPTEELIAKAEALPFANSKAVKYMKIAASRGDPHAEEYLARYRRHQEEKKEEKEKKRVEERDAAYLAARQADQRGDYASAKRQYKALADAGHPDAMHNYARLAYRSGNTAEAIRYLQKSIDTGYYDDPETHQLLDAMKSGKRINVD